MFTEELEFLVKNQEEFVRRFPDKVLVLHGQSVIGVYATTLEAYLEAQKQYPLGSFMIQPCQPGPDAYTVTVHSTCLALG